MSDATPHMYVWEVAGGACGASRDRERAMAVVGNELTAAKPGATATVIEVRVSEYGVDYIPVRVIGRAERTEHGVIWTTAAVPVAAHETASRPGLSRGAGRDAPDGAA